jgi:hypothetical protein
VAKPKEFENGKPVHARNAEGVPICGYPIKTRSGEPSICHQTILAPNGRCTRVKRHKGSMPRGDKATNFKHGKYSKDILQRDYLITRLANAPTIKEEGVVTDKVLLDELFDLFADAIAKKDHAMARFVFEHIAGKPDQTIKNMIADSKPLDVLGEMCAEWDGKVLNGKEFLEAFISRLEPSQ